MAHLEATIRSKQGPILPGATVTVFDAGQTSLANLFSDDGLTVAISNPTTADDDGVVNFYVVAGKYDLLVQRFDIEDRLLEDVEIITAADSGNPTGTASGDLGGSYPSPTVDGVSGKSITNSPAADNDVLLYASGTDDLSWGSANASTDPTELVLTAHQFMGTAAGNNATSGSDGVRQTLGEAGPSNRACTTKLPPSFYGVSLNFDIMVDASSTTGDVRFTFGIENTASADTPSSAVTQTLTATGDPELHTLGTITESGVNFGGMVHVVIGRDPLHVDDNLSGAARVYFVRITPT